MFSFINFIDLEFKNKVIYDCIFCDNLNILFKVSCSLQTCIDHMLISRFKISDRIICYINLTFHCNSLRILSMFYSQLYLVMFILFTIFSLSPVFSTVSGSCLAVSSYRISKFSKSSQFLPYCSTSFGL